jgi:hypothetical protein
VKCGICFKETEGLRELQEHKCRDEFERLRDRVDRQALTIRDLRKQLKERRADG